MIAELPQFIPARTYRRCYLCQRHMPTTRADSYCSACRRAYRRGHGARQHAGTDTRTSAELRADLVAACSSEWLGLLEVLYTARVGLRSGRHHVRALVGAGALEARVVAGSTHQQIRELRRART